MALVVQGSNGVISTNEDSELCFNNYPIIPIGIIFPYYGDTSPNPTWLICDGRDTTGTPEELEVYYPLLYAQLGYSNKLPDLRHRFLEGSDGVDVAGTHKSAGLPNIKGKFERFLGYINKQKGSGALYKDGGSYGRDFSPWGNNAEFNIGFDANKGECDINGNVKTADAPHIYGNSDTVQPEAIIINYIIKAK